MRTLFFTALLGSTALLATSAIAQSGQPAAQGQPNTQAQQRSAQQPAAGNQATTTAQPGAVTASSIRSQPIYNQSGQEFGRANNVVRGQDNRMHIVVAAGDRQVVVPIERLAYDNNRYVVRGLNEEQLRALPAYRQGQAEFREVEGNERVQIAGAPGQQIAGAPGQQNAQAQQGQDGSRIMVQQAAPTVRVDQGSPQVVVQQAQPNVTVQQGQPEILVRQPQPTVTVDIPQPEIIVRMPRPDVNVAMAQPQVQVNQPRPQVQVMPPQSQPQVQVDRAQPQVMVQQAQNEPQVNVQREGQPQVRYERAEPRVVVNQAQGQPNVRIEQMPEQQAQAGQRQAAQGQPVQQRQTSAGSVYSEEQRRTVRERLNAGDGAATAAANANVQMRPVSIGELEDKDVHNARGEELGEVDRVILTPQGQQFLVVGSGGFLGIGRDRVAFPLERFWLRGDRLVIRGVTEQDIEAMDDYRDTVDSFQRVGRNERASLRLWQ